MARSQDDALSDFQMVDIRTHHIHVSLYCRPLRIQSPVSPGLAWLFSWQSGDGLARAQRVDGHKTLRRFAALYSESPRSLRRALNMNANIRAKPDTA
jgi:hypothetical protein